jgi:putative methyltransferase (TIGR04325 family)
MLKSVEYQRVPSFADAKQSAGDGYSNPELLSELQSSWFYVGEPRLTDLPDFFGPFFTAIAIAHLSNQDRQIRVLDFGGAIGRYGAYASAMFSGKIPLEWIVVETEMYAKKGRDLGVDAQFYQTVDDVPGSVDMVIFSGVLQYLENWRSILANPVVTSAPLVFISRTPIGATETPFLQVAHYDWGTVKLAATIIAADDLSKTLGSTHALFASWALEQHLGELGVTSAPSQIWKKL